MSFPITAVLVRLLRTGAVAAALLALAAIASPAHAVESDLRACTNEAWADYNACLMETNSWWVQKGCDIAFQAEYLHCWAEYYADIR